MEDNEESAFDKLRKFVKAITNEPSAEAMRDTDKELEKCGMGEQKVDRQGKPIPCRKK